MKKKNLNSLKLNKKSISNFESNLVGGHGWTAGEDCYKGSQPPWSDCGPCYSIGACSEQPPQNPW